MSRYDYDAIVIGAGPGGSTAAAECARAGLRTLLLEKDHLPRRKTCGGGMAMVVGNLLPGFEPNGVIEQDVLHMRHTWRYDTPILGAVNADGEKPRRSLWMVQRSVFDNALAQRAASTGADLIDGIAVRAVEADDAGVSVRASRDGTPDETTWRARHVIGADGVKGVTARCAGLRRRRTLAIGMEVELPHRWGDGHEDLRPDVLHLEYGAVHYGYAWVFPKGNHLNIGAGIFRPHSEDGRGRRGAGDELRKAICDYARYLGLRADMDALPHHAHPIPPWNGREPLHTHGGRVLLVGDAAGLVNPLFGDGILSAIRSGLIAAKVVEEGDAARYTQRLHAEIARDLDAALRLSRVFYQFAGIAYRYGIMRPGVTAKTAQLIAGEAMFTDVTGRAMRRFRRAIARLGDRDDDSALASPDRA